MAFLIDPANIDMLPINHDVTNEIKLDFIPDYDYDVYNLQDEKSYKKFITDLEREVRSSFEYKRLMTYLKDHMGMNRCAFLQNTTINPDSKVTIEIHHHPFTLYDICTIVCTKRMYYGESMELEMVAKEVMQLHYEGKVGLLPLSKTPHELYHNGYLPIPLSNVYGNWRAFKNQYNDFLSDEQNDILERIEQFDLTFDKNRVNDVLENNTVRLSTTIEEYQLPDFTEVKDRMTARINDIKANHYQLPTVTESEYSKRQKLLEDQQKQEEERKRNMINPIHQYINPIHEINKEVEDIDYAINAR